MKGLKLFFILCFLFVLTSCSSVKSSKTLTNKEVKDRIQTLLDSSYYESSIYFQLKTEEMNLEINPLLKIKNLITDDGNISSISYDSSLLQAFNISSFEMIIDEQDQLIYIYTNNEWIKMDTKPLGNEIESDVIDLTTILSNILLEFNNLDFIDTNGHLQHYQIEINVLKAMKEIYNFIYGDDSSAPNFETIIQDLKLSDLSLLFESFQIDLYVDKNTNTIAKVEINFMQILDFIINHPEKFKDQLPDEIDFNKLRDYFQQFVIGFTFDQVNAKETIEISDEAINAEVFDISGLFIHNPNYDFNSPILTLNGSSTIFLKVGEPYIEEGAIAFDFLDGDLTSTIQKSGSVNISKEGTNTITYHVTDRHNNEVSITRTIIVIPADLVLHDTETNLFLPIYTEHMMHPSLPIIYFISGNQLLAYHLNTGKVDSVTFTHTPERMTFSQNKLYVTLLKGEHSSYWWNEDQEGAYAVLNADLSNSTIYDINLDPFDIAVDRNGYVYIPSGSGQWTNLQVYSPSGEHIKTGFVRQQSFIEYNPILNKTYLVDTDLSPRDIESFSYDQTTNTIIGYDSRYHGDYSLDTSISISPDGNKLFNSSGAVFTSHTSQDNDLVFIKQLQHSYQDIAFNLEDNEFYLLNDNHIYTYSYDTLTLKSSFKILSGDSIYFLDDTLYVLDINEDYQTYLRTYLLS